ncbi:tryptophanyl-tRNA synthetase [Metschnikowia bicuspidata var. bicuspidata NRRL YB-4993]|uniref:Tryptophan--tRNA ligase, mitochondrial n=1 Tax=Metschnikowia bicuspidata var. bicuspidata NRRL YB-4993 TaxID=869754 RepID=A0A1A0HKF9_9ASCO|nr:tryptophanyl-tRNA synthetase [Metschnikowia bicuspidata var. bicuspidata NRRL YB-4993]OBA24510.1 tryptophanyl-tRNA synthetase [Metschnikowia bicuspidata var. bicuspidata NRRL YB-4993]
MSPQTVSYIRSLSSVATLDKLSAFPRGSRIFSLIQPTGAVHLGNYLGALRNWKQISTEAPEDTQCIFGTADLHSVTQLPSSAALHENRYGAVANILLAGIDPKRCILFHQSSVPEHAELYWIFTCLTSMGSLNRMTQWKLKLKLEDDADIYSERAMGATKAGLLLYPVLQAADIMIYNATHVPVGEDQSQHLELSRDIASTFNHKYGKFFTLPQTILTPTKKIGALRDPTKKMSKSDANQSSSVFINDDADTIAKKFRRAVTDSVQGPVTFDPRNRPGVSNLVNIISGLLNKTVDETVKELAWVGSHKQLKDYVTELVVEEFKETKTMYDNLMADKSYIDAVCAEGTTKAREIALVNIKEIKRLVGLL